MVITVGTTIYDANKSEYNVSEYINSGSYGSVFRLEDKDSNLFALKTLPESYRGESILTGLINDFQNAIKVDGENILKQIYLHNGSTYNNLPPYIIMEYANGGTLRDIMEDGQVELDTKLSVMVQIIHGMKSINSLLIHRDLKPENILINDNVVKISDFGLSKLAEDVTRTKSFKGLGTPLYMSPEAWRYEDNTILMDIYSVGIMFYELITGIYPFEYDASDPDSLEKAHLYSNIKPISNSSPDIPLNISQLITKMTKKNPQQRCQTWKEVEELLNHKSIKESKYANLIKTIATQKEATESEEEKRRLEAEQRRRLEEEYKARLHFIIKDEVITPFEEFLSELQDEIHEEYTVTNKSPLEYLVNVFSKGNISLTFQILEDDMFIREVPSPFSYDGRGVNKAVRPKYKGEEILLWGLIEELMGCGFNLFLTGDLSNNNYKWHMTRSVNSKVVIQGSHTKDREPFGFDFQELKVEVSRFNAMHVYNTSQQDFAIDYFAELVSFVLAGSGYS